MKLNVSMILLFVVFSISAQPKLSFDKLQHDFGKVNESDGSVTYDFAFKNAGTAPLVIQNVTTTCGCTTPEWPKQPIRPGDTGFIKVGYDVKGRPGAIDRTITVHSNDPTSPTRLRIIGEVIPAERTPAEQFRHAAGAIRLDNMHASFNRIHSHESPSFEITALNPSPDAVKISFVNLPAHIKADVTPATVASGEKATIKITYDAARKNEWGFVSDRIVMILNDNRAQEHRLTVTATIEEDFSRWTAAQLQNAPAIVIDQQVIEAGTIKKGERKTYQVKLTNNGKSKLLIRRVVPSGSLTANAPKEINPGESVDMTITFNSTGQTGALNRAIEMITNDPKNAKVVIRFKAEVTE